MLMRPVLGLFLLTACLNAQVPSSTIAGSLGRQVDSVMQVAERAGFSGVVRVDTGGVTILEKGYGKRRVRA